MAPIPLPFNHTSVRLPYSRSILCHLVLQTSSTLCLTVSEISSVIASYVCINFRRRTKLGRGCFGASLGCSTCGTGSEILTAPRNLAGLVTLTLLNLEVAAIDSTPHLLVLSGIIHLLFPFAGIPSACGWFVVVPVCCLD
ncbi:hypothetical protein KC19_12G149300 [Ceratodon purpureus]|uniref:Uncharacterized protein n=1 Tax=Ceratodon purpureus TaxID=3225 RepID=A0A8T0GBF1_CERPU|nr:hypothetical protein KC19_12G149300 [Ceratodon purpureus]